MTTRNREQLEDAYAKSILSGGGSNMRFTASVPSVCRGLWEDMSKFLSEALMLRFMQPAVEAVIRLPDSKRRFTCAPNISKAAQQREVPTDATLRFDRKWTVREKFEASFGQTLIYVVLRCRAAKRFRGGMIPYTVQVRKTWGRAYTELHANFIYLEVDEDPVRVYLMEPNGRRFTQNTDAVPRLEAAIRSANEIARAQGLSSSRFFEAGVHVIGTEGVQNNLGYSVEARAQTESYGICGAVTFWSVHKWLVHTEDMDLRDFVPLLEAEVKADPRKARRDVLDFMNGVTKYMAEDLGDGTRINKLLKKKLQDDLDRFRSDACVSSCSAYTDHIEVGVSGTMGGVEYEFALSVPDGVCGG